MSTSESEVSGSMYVSQSSNDEEVHDSHFQRYQNEPLADSNDDMNEAVEDNEDADSLAPSILEARYEKSIKVDPW